MPPPGASFDIVSKLSNLLPTGTFLTFQAVAPLFTNNGECGPTEKVMTGILLFMFASICWVINFTDSITTVHGTVYYGIVTSWGLFNPQFKGTNIIGVTEDDYFYDDPENKYTITFFDYVNGVMDLIALGALIMLTPPITTCYYPNISNTLVKTLPILVAIIVACYFAFAPPPRQGIGFSLPTGKVQVGSQSSPESSRELLPTSKGKEVNGHSTEPRVATASSPDKAIVPV